MEPIGIGVLIVVLGIGLVKIFKCPAKKAIDRYKNKDKSNENETGVE